MKRQSRKPLPSDVTVTIGDLPEEAIALALGRELRESFGSAPEPVPAGWYTTEQWAQKWGYARAYAHRLLAHGVEIGRVEWRKFRVPTETKKAYAMVHYRMKAKAT